MQLTAVRPACGDCKDRRTFVSQICAPAKGNKMVVGDAWRQTGSNLYVLQGEPSEHKARVSAVIQSMTYP